MTRSGFLVSAARSQIGSAEVFVARHRSRRRLGGEITENLLFDFQFLRGRFDHDLDIAHFNGALEATMRARPSFAFSSVMIPRLTASA